ncbi:hypothetical protein F4810DRAFT_666377 [Camillea tinctor]|nr:hypothetical protein F4810DRAFT_666377 [Camillea tinctor]
MAESSQPDNIYGHTSIARRFVTIASDQRKLLDRNESWASFLRRRPNGFVNVPPEVLENLKEAYIRQLEPIQSDDPPSSTEARQDDNEHAEADDGHSTQDNQSSSSDEDEGEQNNKEGNNDDDDNVDATKNSSWPASPEDHFRPRCEMERDMEPDCIEDEPFATQISETSPPKPTIQPPPKRPVFNDFPPSSLEQDDELEFEVPTALSNDPLPSSKTPRKLSLTPPSAQIVPCTFEVAEALSKPKIRGNPKQPIYKPPPPLYRSSKAATTSMGLKKTLLDDAQSSNSTSNTSSSIIPSTKPDESTHKHIPAWMNQPVSSPTREPQVIHRSVERGDPSQEQPLFKKTTPQSPQPRSSPPLPPIMHRAVSPVQPIANPEAPFTRYTVAYPTYNGSINDFITACMYIQLQQRRLRTSLYDDFIRAWFEGYLPYVKDCDDGNPQGKVMNAIEWYNSIDDDPLFTSRVVTRPNLEATLNFYPQELQAAKSLLGVVPASSRESTQSLNLAPLGKKQTAVLEAEAPPAETRAKQAAKSDAGLPPPPKLEESTLSRLRLPTRTSPQKEPNRTMPPPKPVEEVVKRRVQSKGLSRSFSEVVPNKRKASNDLDGDAPKRVSASFRMRSDSGSNTSHHSGSSKVMAAPPSATPSSSMRKKKKSADDPERRSRQFAKFLKQRKWEKESIASSAPVSSMPPSGQK